MMEYVGNCRILEEVGSGGMAVVYKAVQEPLGRTVAVKALKPSMAVDTHFAERFEREARFMAALQHENILHLYDFVKDGKTMFIVMEYVQGPGLHELLKAASPLPVDVAVIIALQVARALDYAHFRGVVHRDIKPANVMLSRRGEVKLMDFGIAREERSVDAGETAGGIGTPSYMSPEQILGGRTDFRSDLFSLGIVLHEMVTGSRPFVEDDAGTVMQKIRLDRGTSARRLNPNVSRHLDRIIRRCMEKLPANRYPTTQALMEDLTEFLAHRVHTSHNARLVMFLRDAGVVTRDEADDVLAGVAQATTLPGPGQRRVVLEVARVQATLLLLLVAMGVGIQAKNRLIFGSAEDIVAGGASVIPKGAGYVQVVVEPWAHVFIDGERVATTPTAERFALSPGGHLLRFENPFLAPQERTIRIRTNVTARVSIALQPTTGHARQPNGDGGAGARR